MLTDMIVILVLLVILGGALLYIRKEKKKGVTCIGCPDADVCAKRRAGASCQSANTEN